jgi:Fe-S-cluster-containing hydrogenase component 2
MLRKIIEIDEEKCDGCALCIPSCPEGAIQMVDGKARLVKDFYCDGLGACLGNCPQGAISVIEREADAYDERAVMKNMIARGEDVVNQHLVHLKEHGEDDLLREAEHILEEYKNRQDGLNMFQTETGGGCPGSQSMSFGNNQKLPQPAGDLPSALTHWPVQMHLISPQASHYHGADILLAADCVAFTMADFHQKYLNGKKLAIACPKLDQGQEIYLEKLQALIDQARINSISVMVMQVPCCSGLVQLARAAVQSAQRDIPLKVSVIGINGRVLREI